MSRFVPPVRRTPPRRIGWCASIVNILSPIKTNKGYTNPHVFFLLPYIFYYVSYMKFVEKTLQPKDICYKLCRGWYIFYVLTVEKHVVLVCFFIQIGALDFLEIAWWGFVKKKAKTRVHWIGWWAKFWRLDEYQIKGTHALLDEYQVAGGCAQIVPILVPLHDWNQLFALCCLLISLKTQFFGSACDVIYSTILPVVGPSSLSNNDERCFLSARFAWLNKKHNLTSSHTTISIACNRRKIWNLINFVLSNL